MFFITENEFKKLPLEKKYKVVSEEGHFIAKRIYRGMEVYLYKVNEFYAEVWKRYMMAEIHWIEPVPEKHLEKYADFVDLKSLMK